MEFERKVVDLDVNDVLPNRFQPRIKFNEDSINELSESIKEHGVIQPIVVRSMGDKYEIIAGERRYKATLLAGKQTIPAVITDLNDKDSAEVALIENVQRKDLTPIEEAISYKKILDMGYLTQEELATKLGKNQSTVANKLRLLNLAEEVQEAVLEEKISERHARSLLKLQDQNKQIEMLDKIMENRLTVRKTDEEIAKILKPEPVVIEDVNEFNPFKIEPLNKEEDDSNEGGTSKMNNEFDPFKIEEPVLINETSTEPKGMFDFAMPSAPIEEVQTPVNNVEQNLPGFMDVSKIEETAQDINLPKPEVNLNSLLTPTVEEQPTPVVEEEAKVELPSNKFFNLPFADEVEPSFDPFAPLESKKVEEPKPVETIEVANSEQPTIATTTQQTDDFFEFNFDDALMPTPAPSAPSPIEEAPVTPVEVTPVEPVSLEEVQPVVLSENISIETMPTPEKVQVEDNIIGEELPVPTLKVEANRNMMDALEVIRNCSKQLENLGFITDVEEIDFESMYQVIFKIKK